MRRISLIISLLALVFASLSAFSRASGSLPMQFDSFYEFISNLNKLDALHQSERSRMVQEKYNAEFGYLFRRDDVNSLSKENMHLLLDVASITSFENPSGPTYKDALTVLHALGADASDREIRTAQGMLFQSRRSHELDAFSLRYSSRGLAEPVEFKMQAAAGMHEVLIPSAPSGRQLIVKSVDIKRGPRVVVIAHPLCHFTQEAMKEIETHSFVKNALRNNAIWIAPPDRNMDLNAFSKWHNAHPDAPISIAYSYSSWSEIGEWGTPTFYFFRNGRLMHTVIGWPKGGRMNDLKAGLAEIGLTDE